MAVSFTQAVTEVGSMTRKKREEVDFQELEQEYASLAPLAESFCGELASQVGMLLAEASIPLGFPVQYRVKQWESLAEKFRRLPGRFRSIRDIQDVVGLRIILLFKRDVEWVSRLIADHFVVVRQYDTRDKLKADQFGYSSLHFVVEVPETWLKVPTLARMGGLRAEVQVRTLAQHIWAEAAHELQYKQQESVPPSVLRAIYRVSALLETVDLEFDRVLEQRHTYREAVDISGSEDELNVDLLERTLDELLPRENKGGIKDYADLLRDLGWCGVTTQQELVDLVAEHLDVALEADRVEAKREGTDVFFNHSGLVRVILDIVFGYRVSISGEPLLPDTA